MTFATDRDLLALEPTLFRDVAWAGQRLLSTTGTLAAETGVLTIAADAEAVGIGAGHVAVIDGLPVEVLQRTSPTTLTVSLLRPRADGPLIPPPALASRPVTVHTFAPQIAVVHAQLLRAIGVDASDPHAPQESDITNGADLAHAEALGALHLIYAAAAGMSTSLSPHASKAAMYERRFRAARARTPARLDLDHDGRGETLRHFNHYRLLRA